MLAVLLGASTFPNAPKLAEGRAFYISAADVKEYLWDERGLALPRRNVLSLFDDSRSPSDQLMEVAHFLARRTLELKSEGSRPEDLLIYYVGHGLFSRGDQAYCLAIRSTNEINEGATSIRTSDLAGVIKEDAAFLRRYLILDCCFAASIHKEFQSGALSAARVQVSSEFPKRGTALLCSSNAREPSLAPQGLDHTMFSHALIQALRNGHEAAGARLSFSELGDVIKDNLRVAYPESWVRPEVHSPDQREGDIAHIPLFPNHAYRERETTVNQAGSEYARPGKTETETARRKLDAERIAQERVLAERAAQEKAAQEQLVKKNEEARAAAQKAAAQHATRQDAATAGAKGKEQHQSATTNKASTIRWMVLVAVGVAAFAMWLGRRPQSQPDRSFSTKTSSTQTSSTKIRPQLSPNSPGLKDIAGLNDSDAATTNSANPVDPLGSTGASRGATRFTIGGPAEAPTVLDTRTSLMWTGKDYWDIKKAFAATWDDAMNWAKTMNTAAYAGYSDWSVPTIVQYRTINGSKADREDYRRFFEKTNASLFWASNTPSQYVASYMSFEEGYAVSGAKTNPTFAPNAPMSVRLVRAR